MARFPGQSSVFDTEYGIKLLRLNSQPVPLIIGRKAEVLRSGVGFGNEHGP